MKSDKSSSYTELSEKVESHVAKVIKNEAIEKELPWVDIAISNAKRWMLNTFHFVSQKHLQSYLDEFCYNFNRRYMRGELYDRLLVVCLSEE
ncbi:hypothetical protein HNQ88_001276 [Aureibacter tunicatorum]|uniref:ISXO2-like transposase domain-containing protein n=1 Tax=Aureibacter tunicatorum TaxID=866807 RepID=A0AAE4BRX2_9BACT|nr:hypothetical protein [Aureibacter tunicatorum]